ncbi:hypothetical protein SAMN05444339_101239 [Loktanella atrilutea]|uniref:Uncharacterized protein n=1 Tax=Loktanella atrilutea TaxID=366533 RepID=A0A1M4T3A7_LOKAT|nr:hypothetical protein SAMN05444339_101239 [Loktanella atrilutea]
MRGGGAGCRPCRAQDDSAAAVAIGSIRVATAPVPGRARRPSDPPLCSAKPRAMDRPIPAPCPSAFVVK